MRRSMLVLALAGSLAACDEGPGPSGPPPPGCDKIAWNATCYTDPAATEATCASDAGTWVATGCTSVGAVGMCIGASGRVTYYYSNLYASHEAGLACSMAGGTFVPMGVRVVGSCDARSTIYGICIDLAGTESDMAASGFASECAWVGATWSTTAACPTAGRTGTCSSVAVGLDFQVRFYDPATAAGDAAECTGGGDTWTPN